MLCTLSMNGCARLRKLVHACMHAIRSMIPRLHGGLLVWFVPLLEQFFLRHSRQNASSGIAQ